MQSQKILFVVFFKVSKYALSFVFFYLLVHFYEPTAIGIVQFAIAFVAIFSFIFNLGFSVAHLKIYPEEENKESCIGTLLSFKVIFIFFSLVFYFSLLNFLNLNYVLTAIIIIFIIEIIIQSINTSMSNILIADNEILKGSFPWIAISSSKIILLIIGLFIYPTDELTLAFIYLLSTIFHTLFLLPYIFHYKIGRPNKRLLKKYLQYIYPLILSNITILVAANIGIILINIWISSEAVAYYYAGDHLSTFRTIIPNVISLVMIPIFSKNANENKLENNKQIIKKISKYACILYGGVILLSFLYSDEIIILLIGETYSQSIFIFNVLVLTQIIIINNIAVYADLNARGLTKLFSIITIIGEIYNILLIVLFITPIGLNLGINGLALAYLFKYITYTPIVRFFLFKKYKYGYNFGIFLYLGVILIIYLLNCVFFLNMDFIKYFYFIPIFALFNIAVYFGLLYALRGIKREDIKYFKLLLNPKSLINILYKDLSIKSG